MIQIRAGQNQKSVISINNHQILSIFYITKHPFLDIITLMRTLNSFILLLMICCLASCATMTRQQPSQNTKTSWDARVQTLSSIQNWNLKALIGVREQHEAWSANLQWKQQQQNYVIALYGPLGTNTQILTGQPGKVELASSNGKKFYASSPEGLLAQQLGWSLPVSNLYYWVRGIPVPNMPAQKQFDNANRLVQLNQQGWTIQYLRYTSLGNIDVPSKIFLDNPRLNVKIIINQWQF